MFQSFIKCTVKISIVNLYCTNLALEGKDYFAVLVGVNSKNEYNFEYLSRYFSHFQNNEINIKPPPPNPLSLVTRLTLF